MDSRIFPERLRSRTTGGMEIGRSGHTATLLPNGSVLVAGGGIFAGLASAELYQ
ncbi:MAG: hypothetical protein WAK48_21725 [Candidatus Acidiferrum sp.]